MNSDSKATNQCNWPAFTTTKALRSHMTRQHPIRIPQEQEPSTEHVGDPSSDYRVNEHMKTAYHSGYATSIEYDQSHVYDFVTIDMNDITLTELYSVILSDLMSKYGGSKELHRELVRLIRTIKKDKNIPSKFEKSNICLC
ncbi:unnamed protein product [Rhizopus stolonifer]